jgi:AsmA protein
VRPARIVAVAVAVLGALVLLPAAAVWVVSRSDWAAAQAASRASAALGQPVRLDGLAVGLWPSPSVELEGLAVGAGDPGPLLSLERGTAVMRWSELSRAPVVLRRLRLSGLTLRPRIGEDGQDNWTALVERVIELAGTGPAAFEFGDLAIESGRVEYTDQRSDAQFVVSSLVLEASEVRPAGAFPLALRLAGEVTGHVFHAAMETDAMLDPDYSRYGLTAAALKGWIGGGAFGMGGADLGGGIDRLDFDFVAQTARLEGLDFDALGVRGRAQAEATSLLDAPVVDFALETEPFAPRATANAIGRTLPATADPQALGEAELALEGRFGPDGLALKRIAGRIDDTSLAGSLAIPPPPATAKLALSLDVLDLDRYLPPGPPEPVSPGEALGSLLGVLAGLDVEAVIEVERASAAGAVARGLRVVIEPQANGATPP